MKVLAALLLAALLMPASPTAGRGETIGRELVAERASELDDATRELYRAAARERGEYGVAERLTLDDLAELKRAAHQLCRKLERRRVEPYVLDAGYRDLHRAFRRASLSIHSLRAVTSVYELFDRVERRLEVLDEGVEAVLMADRDGLGDRPLVAGLGAD